MSQDALVSWKEECDAIHGEMDRLLAAGWLGTAEERQVRKIQFMALIERRNVAAQRFIKSDRDPVEASTSRQDRSEASRLPPNPRPILENAPVNVSSNQKPPGAVRAIYRNIPASPDDPMFVFESTKVEVPQELPEALLKPGRDLDESAAAPKPEVEATDVKIPEEPPVSPPATDRDPPVPDADQIFEVGNFLKQLGMK
jgi:hypothetical protein